MKKLGIALGGGGAKGLAHVPMLEALDELGIRPYRISGTSIGAIIGVLYAAGHSGRQIREDIDQMTFTDQDSFTDALSKKGLFRWLEYIDIEWHGSSLLKADSFLEDCMRQVGAVTFEELNVPLMIVAADFWKRRQVVFTSGELKPAVQASMALPGIFSPVIIDDRVLIDGGAVNPVPYDLLQDECDCVVAIDVMGNRTESADLIPSISEAVFNTFQIMQRSILDHKFSLKPPDVYIAPEIVDIRMMEFYKADIVFNQAQPAKAQLKRKLVRLMETTS